MSIVKVAWKNLRVPESLFEKIKSISTREKRAHWEVVLDAISYYESMMRKPRLKEDLPPLDKISWYIVKLTQAVSWYIATGKDENYWLTLGVIEDTGKRLEVDMSILVEALTNYRLSKKKSSKKRATVYKALKMIIQEILSTKLTETPSEQEF